MLTILAGLYFRLKVLGKYPLAIDEYYILQSVQNILGYDISKFNFSGYCDEGILYQYIVLLMLLTGIKAEFGVRIISVATNLITLIPLYPLTKKIEEKHSELFSFLFFILENFFNIRSNEIKLLIAIIINISVFLSAIVLSLHLLKEILSIG